MASIPVVAAIVFLTAALFFLTFFSSFIRRCSHRVSTSTTAASHSAVNNPIFAPISRRGLDHTVIDSFPTFDYAAVSSYNIGNGALECYVCLNEFEAHETLRLIPVCDHAFHVGCIDAWLASNATCPVCRANLHDHHELTQITGDQNDDVVIINVTDHQDPPRPKLKRNLTWWSLSSGQPRLARSKSTGRVAVKEWEIMERFTLRMPEEVRRKIGGGKLRRSMTSSDEGISGRRGNRVTGGGGSHGEESSWGRWFFRRSKSTR